MVVLISYLEKLILWIKKDGNKSVLRNVQRLSCRMWYNIIEKLYKVED